jgi:hypothetical protein
MKVALTIVGAVAEFIALGLVVGDFYDARAFASSILRPAPAPRDGPPSHADVLFATTPTVEAIQHGQATEAALRTSVASAFAGSESRKRSSIALL